MAIETITIDTEQWAVVSKGALQMVVNALRRDAEDGRGVRGEMADELLAAAPRPEAGRPANSVYMCPDHGSGFYVGLPSYPSGCCFVCGKRPEAVRQSTPLSDAELVDLIYRAGLGHTSDLLYEKSKDGIEVDYPTVEARKLAAFLMQQPDRTPKKEPRPVPTASIEQAPDVLSEAIHYVGNKDLGGLVTREFLSGANAIIKALEEYRDEFSRDSAPVPTSERLPTEADADPFGHVLAFHKIWWPTNYMTLRMCPGSYTHWQPTGLVRPAEPDGGAV